MDFPKALHSSLVPLHNSLTPSRRTGALFDGLMLWKGLDPEDSRLPLTRNILTPPSAFSPVSSLEKIDQERQKTQTVTCGEQLEGEFDVVQGKALIFLLRWPEDYEFSPIPLYQPCNDSGIEYSSRLQR